jgi:hypothetical protein
MLNRIVPWITENRSDIQHLGTASIRLIKAVLTCWGIYMVIRHGDTTVTGWAIVRAISNVVSAGTDVTVGIVKLHRRNCANGKGAPTADNDRAPLRQ